MTEREEADIINVRIRKQREKLKWLILDEVGPRCEVCQRGFTALDLHEVFVTRQGIPKRHQVQIMVRRNCAVVCQTCHSTGQASAPEFKEKFAQRLKALGYGLPYSIEEFDKHDG